MTLNIKSSGNGKPIVLFHGWGFDQTIWSDLAASIHDRFEVFLVDLPGFGHSPLMDWEQFKSSLLAVLPDHFAVLGWSLGGLFATRLAAEESERVTRLINVASSPRFIIDRGWPGIEEQILADFHRNLIANPQQTMVQFVELQLQSRDYTLRPDALPTSDGLQEGLQILANWDLRETLRHLKCPVCYMFGRLDAIVPRTLKVVMQAEYAHFDYVLFNKAAHVPFLSDKTLFIKELERFIL